MRALSLSLIHVSQQQYNICQKYSTKKQLTANKCTWQINLDVRRKEGIPLTIWNLLWYTGLTCDKIAPPLYINRNWVECSWMESIWIFQHCKCHKSLNCPLKKDFTRFFDNSVCMWKWLYNLSSSLSFCR